MTQINIATGDAVIHATQDTHKSTVSVLSKKEKLERHLRVFKRHLETETDEQTIKDFREEIKVTEEAIEYLKKNGVN